MTMTYDGFLAFGGNEVLNSERARAYSRGAGCPMGWLKDEPCQGLAYAVGDSGYSYLDIVNAPWYDSTIDEISRRFYGVYGLEISGVEDSTRKAQVTEGIGDGGQIGRARRASRDVKVQALILGKGQDAVEYGMSWLNSVLDPDACGQLSTDCGTATMNVFSTCPPVRKTLDYLTDWAIQQTNLLTNPSFETGGAAVVVRTQRVLDPAPPVAAGAPASGNWKTNRPANGSLSVPVAGEVVYTITTGGTGLTEGVYAVSLPATVGSYYSATFEMKAEGSLVGRTIPSSAYPILHNGITLGTATGVPATFDGTWQKITILGTTAATTASAVNLIAYVPGALAGDVLRVRNPIVEERAAASMPAGTFFTGSSQPTLRTNYAVNPNFETSTANWNSAVGGALTRTTAQFHSGTACMQVVTPGSAVAEGAYSTPATIPGFVAGAPFSGSIWVLAPAGATLELMATCTGSGGSSPSIPFTGTGAWQYVAAPNALAAAGANPYVLIRTRGTAQAITFYVDDALIELTSTPGTSFDGGSAPNGYATGWTGTANASPSIMWDADFSTRWQGTVGNSGSELTGVGVAGWIMVSCFAVQSSRWVKSGSKSVRVIANHPTNRSYVEVAGANIAPVGTDTAVASVHLESPLDTTGSSRALRIGMGYNAGNPNALSTPAVPAPGDTELRLTATMAVVGRLILFSDTKQGDPDVWWDLATLVAGVYTGPAFTGSSTPTDPNLQRYAWTGAADTSTSTYETRQWAKRPQTDAEYAASIDLARRYMRRAGAISGPLKLEELRSGDDFWAYKVQFVLNGGPSILGVTKVLQLGPTTPTVVQDVPYNLIPYPSAELAGAQTVVVAQNLAANPSAEVNATGWVQDFTVVSGTSPTAFLTNGRSTDIGAGGSTASFRVRLLGDNGTTAVAGAVSELVGYQDAAIAAGTNRHISLNMWAAGLVLSGSSPGTVINSMRVTYEFFNGAASLGAQTTFGTFTSGQFGGKASSLAGIAVPAAATLVRVRAIANVTWTSSATAGQNSDIRLYADTLTVSIP